MAVACSGKTNFVFGVFLLIIRLSLGRVHHVQLEVQLFYENGLFLVVYEIGKNVQDLKNGVDFTAELYKLVFHRTK